MLYLNLWRLQIPWGESCHLPWLLSRQRHVLRAVRGAAAAPSEGHPSGE